MMSVLLPLLLLSSMCPKAYTQSPTEHHDNQTASVSNSDNATDATLPSTTESSLDDLSLENKSNEAIESKAILPMETELSLKKLAMIYKKLLHDQDAVTKEHFEDKNLAAEVSKVIDERVHTVKSILEQEAPELAAEVEEEYAKPRRMLIIYGSVAVAIVSVGILALFSYDSTTKTWGKPQLVNATTSLTAAKNALADIFMDDDQPEAAA